MNEIRKKVKTYQAPIKSINKWPKPAEGFGLSHCPNIMLLGRRDHVISLRPFKH